MSEYNDKTCPICHELNDVDADHCYWCKHKFTNKPLETEYKHYCKYCHTPVDPGFPSEDKYGHSCKSCKTKKILCTIAFSLLAGLVYALIINILKTNNIILGAIPTMIIVSVLFLFIKFAVTAVMKNIEKKPIYVNTTDKTTNSVTMELEQTENELHTKIIKELIASGSTKNINVNFELDSSSVMFNNKQVGFLSAKDNELIKKSASYTTTNVKIIHKKENDTYKIQLEVNLKYTGDI